MIAERDAGEGRVSDLGSMRRTLQAEHLQKAYEGRPALRDLSFSVDAGHVLGFLGPNGAGKTTAIRILTTILEPDAGHFTIDGISSARPDQIRQRIGVLPESQGYPKEMTAIDYLVYFGRLYGLSASNAKRTGLNLLEVVGLQQRATSLLGTYSRGMRQRLGIARALVNDPAVVLLDEPTLGLDPRGQQEFLALVRSIARERHAAVILCSHLLWEIESVCDDVVILSVGQVVAHGSVAEVIGQSNARSLRVQVALPVMARAKEVLLETDNVTQVTPQGQGTGWLQVEFQQDGSGARLADSSVTNGILQALITANIPILTYELEGSRLQEVFLHLTEEAIR